MNGGTNLKTWVVMSVLLLGIVSVAAGRTIYVDDDGPADFSNIQAAINDANNGDTVIVADGVYTGPGNRDIDFGGMAITVRSENGPENCIIDCNGTESDRHRGFYFHSGENANSAIIGLTITNGYAICDYCRPPLIFCAELGGAIYCDWYSSPTISNCIISGNTAGVYGAGGGIACFASNPTVSNCIFVGNFAYAGGGMFLIGRSDPTIINCTFSGNEAGGGGGIYNGRFVSSAENSPKVINCIFWGDSPDEIYVYDSTPVITYSDVEGGWAGEGNIDVDPCFADPGYWDANGTPEDANDDFWVDGDYHLRSQAGRWEPSSQTWVQDDVTSPCIDAGNPNSPIGLEPFPNGGRINMGAYGGTKEASKSYFGEPLCRTIVAGDINGDCIINFKDFAIMALHWLEDNRPVNCNSIVKDGIEYYMQTNKSVYSLGETVEMLYRVTNLRDHEVTFNFNDQVQHYFTVKDNGNLIWDAPKVGPPAGSAFVLQPNGYKEYSETWDMVDNQGILITPGTYEITGSLHPVLLAREDKDKYVPVSVSIEIVP